MKKAVIVQPNGKWEIKEFTDENGLQMLQTAVDGLVELVEIKPGLSMWVNEEFLFRQDLNENFMASAIYEDHFNLENRPIYGNAVYTGGADSEGKTLGLDDAHLNLVTQMAEFHQMAIEQTFR